MVTVCPNCESTRIIEKHQGEFSYIRCLNCGHQWEECHATDKYLSLAKEEIDNRGKWDKVIEVEGKDLKKND